MGIVREIHIGRSDGGWYINAGSDHFGPFPTIDEVWRAAVAHKWDSAAGRAAIIIHLPPHALTDPPAALAPASPHPAQEPGPDAISIEQLRAISMAARELHAWGEEEIIAACRERWAVHPFSLTAHQAAEWIDELTAGASQ